MSDNDSRDAEGWLQTLHFSWGIMQIFTNYVTLIGNTVGEYRQAVEDEDAKHPHKKDRIWKVVMESDDCQEQVSYTSTAEAKAAVSRAAQEAMAIFLVLIIASALIIGLLTRNLDDRMTYIIEGVSRLTSAMVIAFLSIRVGVWVDLYTPVWTVFRSDNKRLSTYTIAELKHRVRWSVSRKILRTFFFLWLFFQGAKGVTIPGSIVAGIGFGLAVDYATYRCRRMERPRRKRCASIVIVALLIWMSITQCSSGIFFIAAVWEKNVENVENSTWDVYAFLVYTVVLPCIHVVVWRLGKTTADRALKTTENLGDDREGQALSSSGKPRMAASMYFGKDDIKDAGDENEPDEERVEQNQEVVSTDLDQQAIEMKNVIIEGEQDGNADEEDITQPTLSQLMKEWTWCGCVRGDNKSTPEKIFRSLIWTIYVLTCLLFVFFTFINIYATQQQEYARQKMPFVNEAIYNNMDEGPVCAFDNRGADSNITTFPDKEAAHAQGFQIVHCGACAACSDWHNLRLEYTTRDRLAAEGRKCATKSLFGGSNQVLIDCLESDAIGFQGRCAECWAEDILCTKKFCWAIGVQSFFINTLTNFVVNADTITAAACEEANCEAGNPGHFVSCSGATRRRMNVTSSIARPGAQRCSLVDVDYSTLFPED